MFQSEEDDHKDNEKSFGKSREEARRGGGGFDRFMDKTIGTVIPGATDEWKSSMAGSHQGAKERDQAGSDESSGGGYSSGSSSSYTPSDPKPLDTTDALIYMAVGGLIIVACCSGLWDIYVHIQMPGPAEFLPDRLFWIPGSI